MIKQFAIILGLLPFLLPISAWAAADWDLKDMRLTDYQDLPKLRVSADIGLGYRSGGVRTDIPVDLQNYIYGLRLESGLQLSTAWFFSRYAGAGLEYNRIGMSNYTEDVYLTDLVTGRLLGKGVMKDAITIQAVGPALFGGYLLGSGNIFIIAQIAPLKLYYRDILNLIEKSYRIEGDTWAMKYQLNFDYRIFPYVGFGIDAGLLYGTVGKLTVNGKSGILKMKENISSTNVNIGLRFYL